MTQSKFQGESPIEKMKICPVTHTQLIISGKWKLPILWQLSKQTRRFSDLQRSLPGVSKGILTRHLRELEEDQMVHREVYKEVPPKVEYSLTSTGKSFIPILESMSEWGENHKKSI
ncbi:winged helix-turn-helix transcriptional regulator [Paenibacillus sp. FA6]|uniref:winged helix-turn-helix transcriptional regulator n=1 Tax=Paenibacillus sp. FA6 TaxID=3413029 RepID=UPI003F6559DD